MSSSKLRIIFMGTPEFAVPSLEILLREEYDIVAVITAPDKPAGRGLQLHQSAVKQFGLQKALNVLQPEKLKDEKFLLELNSLQPDVAVVVAFRKLPEAVWNLPRLGTFNLHASLLPAYRGAAPINWAIIDGEKETGVTTFFITHEIDTGKIIMQERVPVKEEETAGELHDKLKMIGASLVLKTVKQIESGNLSTIEQPSDGTFKKAPKIFTDDCRISWNKSEQEVFNLIRGLSPIPGAFTELDGKILKIYKSGKIPGSHTQVPGTISTDGKTFLRFACTHGWIDVQELKLEGKRKMTTEEFLRGYSINQ